MQNEARCHSRYGTAKIHLCSKAAKAEQRPISCSPSPLMVTSLFKRKILERGNTQLNTNHVHVVLSKNFYSFLLGLYTGCTAWPFPYGTPRALYSIFYERFEVFRINPFVLSLDDHQHCRRKLKSYHTAIFLRLFFMNVLISGE